MISSTLILYYLSPLKVSVFGTIKSKKHLIFLILFIGLGCELDVTNINISSEVFYKIDS